MKIMVKNYKYILADQFLPPYEKEDGKPRNNGKMINHLYSHVIPVLLAKTGACRAKAIYVNSKIGYQIVLEFEPDYIDYDEEDGFERMWCNGNLAIDRAKDGAERYIGYYLDKLITDVCDSFDDCLRKLHKYENGRIFKQ